MNNAIVDFKRAGLYPSDISRMLGISRVAVSLWFNGHSRPHKLLRDRVERLHKAVLGALEENSLPISSDYAKKERHGKVRDVIERHLANLDDPPLVS